MPDVPEHRREVVGNTLEKQRRWLEENREAIEAYNRRVAEHGILFDHTGLQGDPS